MTLASDTFDPRLLVTVDYDAFERYRFGCVWIWVPCESALNERDVGAAESCPYTDAVELVDRPRVVEYDGRDVLGSW